MPKPLTKTVLSEWLSYSGILPPDVSQIQLTETRKAFYAGVVSALALLNETNTPDVSLDEGVAYLERLHHECEVFNKEVGKLS